MPPPSGVVSGAVAQAGAGALPGFSASGGAKARFATAHRPRPAAVGRAGLFAWVPVLLSAGIGLWFSRPGQWPDAIWALLAVLLILSLVAGRIAQPWAERGRIGWGVADGLRIGSVGLMLMVAGFGLAELRNRMVAAPVLEWRYYGPVEGRLVQIDRSSRDRIRLTLDQPVLRDLAPEKTPARVRLSLMEGADDQLPALGQRVMLTGHLGPPPGPAAPGSFDFRQYAWFRGLGAVGYSRTPVMSVSAPETGIWAVHRARMAISAQIQARIGGQAGAVASALTTGDRSGIEEATNEVMRASNLYHIVSISGLHMSMLAGFAYAALRYLLVAAQAARLMPGRAVHKHAAVGALLASGGYLWLSGGGVATERAFVMVAVMLIAILVDRRAISLRTVALAATIILILNPEALISPGFQMSFAATIALILSFGPWSRISPHLPFWARPVAMLLVSSFVAGMATAPIAAAHFNRMAQYGLLANLLAVPVMGTLVMPAAVIAAVLAPIGLAGPALWVMGLGTEWMLRVAAFVAGLNGAVTGIALPPGPVVPLMGFGACLCILCWRQGVTARRLTPLAAGFALGGLMLATAAAIWLTASRPLLLIAAGGEAAGLMTDQGRAISKPSGGSFVVSTWLAEDGDITTQAQAADRPAWRGNKRDRNARLPQGWRVWHLTGKGSGDRAVPLCRPRNIVIATEKVPLTAPPDCLLLDPRTLRRTGAVAIDMGSDGPILRSVTGAQP